MHESGRFVPALLHRRRRRGAPAHRPAAHEVRGSTARAPFSNPAAPSPRLPSACATPLRTHPQIHERHPSPSCGVRRPSEEPPKPDDNFARLKEAAVSSVPVVGITAPILTFINYMVTLTTRAPLNSNAIEKLDSQIKGLAIKVDSQSIDISQIKELAIQVDSQIKGLAIQVDSNYDQVVSQIKGLANQVDSQIKGLAAILALLVVLKVGAFVYGFNLVAAELRDYRSERARLHERAACARGQNPHGSDHAQNPCRACALARRGGLAEAAVAEATLGPDAAFVCTLWK